MNIIKVKTPWMLQVKALEGWLHENCGDTTQDTSIAAMSVLTEVVCGSVACACSVSLWGTVSSSYCITWCTRHRSVLSVGRRVGRGVHCRWPQCGRTEQDLCLKHCLVHSLDLCLCTRTLIVDDLGTLP